MSPQPIGIDRAQFVLAEYAALRAEILKQIEVQYQLVGLNLLVFGAALSIASQTRSSSIAGLYPVAALILGLCWTSATHEVERCGLYIKDHIEIHVDRQGWENYLSQATRENPFWARWRGSLAMRGSFVATAAIATVVSVILSRWHALDSVLVASGGVALVLCVSLMIIWRQRQWNHVILGEPGRLSQDQSVQLQPEVEPQPSQT
jgi:hypothetical protein